MNVVDTDVGERHRAWLNPLSLCSAVKAMLSSLWLASQQQRGLCGHGALCNAHTMCFDQLMCPSCCCEQAPLRRGGSHGGTKSSVDRASPLLCRAVCGLRPQASLQLEPGCVRAEPPQRALPRRGQSRSVVWGWGLPQAWLQVGFGQGQG